MVIRGVDSTKTVYPILVDSSGRVYVHITDLDIVESGDGVIANPGGIGIFGRWNPHAQWKEIPVAYFTDSDADRGNWVVPVGTMTSEKVEGTKITDGTDTITLAHGVALPVCTQHHLTTLNINYAGAQADGIVLSPGATDSICIHSIYVSTNDKLTNIELNEETSDDLLFKLYTTNQQTTTSTNLHVDMVAGKDLLITCGAGTFVQICYVLE